MQGTLDAKGEREYGLGDRRINRLGKFVVAPPSRVYRMQSTFGLGVALDRHKVFAFGLEAFVFACGGQGDDDVSSDVFGETNGH